MFVLCIRYRGASWGANFISWPLQLVTDCATSPIYAGWDLKVKLLRLARWCLVESCEFVQPEGHSFCYTWHPLWLPETGWFTVHWIGASVHCRLVSRKNSWGLTVGLRDKIAKWRSYDSIRFGEQYSLVWWHYFRINEVTKNTFCFNQY